MSEYTPPFQNSKIAANYPKILKRIVNMRIQPSEYLKKCLNINLNNQIAALIDEHACIVTFEKGYHPIRLDEEVTSFYFIVYGIVRGYYIDVAGNEVTKCFSSENCFFESECYRTNKCFTFYVECLEDCTCIKFPYSLVREMISLDQQFKNDIERLYFDEVERLENRTKNLLLLSAEERYIFFCKEYPNLQKRLPLKYIASYIGIKAGSMSRIRKKLKNQT